MLWTDGDRHIPVDDRFYDKTGDALTMNDHFRALLETARRRGFMPECVVFDSGYSRLENLKRVRDFGWVWLITVESQPRGQSRPARLMPGDTGQDRCPWDRRPSKRLRADPPVQDRCPRRRH
ncbi:MAG: transposase [Candidatus Competibacteraceae bacterium]|nr:transposase [Candidatus Competibacteraceae bacterium]